MSSNLRDWANLKTVSTNDTAEQDWVAFMSQSY